MPAAISVRHGRCTNSQHVEATSAAFARGRARRHKQDHRNRETSVSRLRSVHPRNSPLKRAGKRTQRILHSPRARERGQNLPADLRDFTRFAFATAWRKGEIASLRWSDVEDGVVRLRGEHSKNRESRQIVIDGEITGIIERRRQCSRGKTAMACRLAEYIFHRHGERIAELRKSWATACVMAG